MKPALLLAAAFALQAQTQPIPQDPEKARLEGVVINAITNEPLRKAHLSLRMNVAALRISEPRSLRRRFTR